MQIEIMMTDVDTKLKRHVCSPQRRATRPGEIHSI